MESLELRLLGGFDFKTGSSRPMAIASTKALLGEIAARSEPVDLETAENQYREALALATELGMRPFVAHCHFALSKLYRRTVKPRLVQEHLTTATAMCREMGMTYWLEKAEAR